MASEESATIPSAPKPDTPLIESYTYHSPLPTSKGPYIIGVDEAGRGPVLGPLVYGIAYCPASYKEDLEKMGFDDSKVLTAATRSNLLSTLSSEPDTLGWSVRVISPQAISHGMLRRPPTNLNRQSEEATILLLREIIDQLEVSEVYVDALGPTEAYQSYLSGLFPGVQFTVTKKADSIYKIVSAASVAAKVTRDACIENWVFEETNGDPPPWSTKLGSGYPSDPNTKAWISASKEPTFGFPSIVRFSWTTAKVLLEKDGHSVKWIDDGQPGAGKAFNLGEPQDKDRAPLMKDLGLHNVVSF